MARSCNVCVFISQLDDEVVIAKGTGDESMGITSDENASNLIPLVRKDYGIFNAESECLRVMFIW